MSPEPYRFGGFTFDPDSGELVGAGGVARLQPQVAALLSVLIEHAGALVSRAELRARLWPETTVEFDDGLNSCIRQLRLALGDDANAPRYIETLPRRGYRFLPAVTRESGGDPPVAARAAPIAEPFIAGTLPPPRPRRRLIVGAAVVLALAAVVAVLGRDGHPPARVAGRQPIVLAVVPFAADTTDPLVAAYRRRLADQILADARAEHGWQTQTRVANATHVLSGSLTRQGGSVKIFVELLLARDQTHLWADSILDTYAFSGNSTITADRIERSVARVLGSAIHP